MVITHVTFEAGITFPWGGTKQSIALRGNEDEVSQLGGVARVDSLDYTSVGVVVVLGPQAMLVPWQKVRSATVIPPKAEIVPLRMAKPEAPQGEVVDAQFVSAEQLPLFQQDTKAAAPDAKIVEFAARGPAVVEVDPPKVQTVRVDARAAKSK